MFNDLITKGEFNAKGSLRSIVTFRFSGDITSVSIRQKRKYEGVSDKAKTDTYYLIIEDKYGFQCAYFRRNMNIETAQHIASKIPYGRTVIIEGEVSIRKGNTFFNVQRIKNPDDTDILYCVESEDEE